MNAAQWLVLDNLRQGWHYRTNLTHDDADKAYRLCVENEWIKDGRLTSAGEAALLTSRDLEKT